MIGVEGVSVRFGPTIGLKNVTLHITPGTIHALAGENGSGKSTLLKVLSGVLPPSEGTVTFDGKPLNLVNVHDAIHHGIGIVFQELSLFPHLSGYSNIVIGTEPVKHGLIADKELRQRVGELLQQVHFPNMDLTKAVGLLSIAEQQMIEILKCLYRSPHVVLFDEPTASLTRREAVSLLKAIRQLRDAGYTIVFVSHHIDEIFELADTVSVLRDGSLVMTSPVSETDPNAVMAAMLGKTIQDFYPTRKNEASSTIVLSLREIQAEHLEPLNLNVFQGEVLGIAGAVGSGANIVAGIMAGWRRAKSGTIAVGGKEVRIQTPADALRHGIGYVPEDRRSESLLRGLSIAVNGTLPLVAASNSPLVASRLFLRSREERRRAEYMVEYLGVRPRMTTTAVDNLSGGNQQKVVIGRWLLHDVPCLVLNNPTKGIDVGAKHDVYRHVLELADSGHAIVFVSTYNDELLGVSDRIAIMYKGRLLGPFSRTELNDDRLLRLTMVGTSEDSAAHPLSSTGGQYGT